MELYRKVEIKSADDLPKEDGNYFVKLKDSRISISVYYWENKEPGFKKVWLECVDWYLQPFELDLPTEAEIIEMANDEQFDDDCWDAPGAIMHGVKWAINEIIKRNKLR